MKELIKPSKSELQYSDSIVDAMCTENDCDCGCAQFNYNSARNRISQEFEDEILF